ncbi:MAG: glycosyltransferase [Candidatus Cloacimonetes bacterium]|nr:glycosyltransferase [Candidatus Cloacimonadota bacterium]
MKYKFTHRQNLIYILSKVNNLFRIFHKIPQRKEGISVMMRVKNEENWIGLSLRSLKAFADEVVIIDNGSTDNTVKEINKVIPDLPFNVIIERNPSYDICEISNRALALTSFRWIVRWDGDFIAYTSGDRNIIGFRKYLLSQNKENFYHIYPVLINFSYDLFHVRKGRELHSEGYIHTFHPSLKYVKKGVFEVLKVPLFYRVKRIFDIYFIHVGDTKSIERLLFRYYWLLWIRNKNMKKGFKIVHFIRETAKKVWDTENLREIIQEIFNEQQPYLEKFNIEKYGDYPQLLKPELKNQKYRIVYKDGKPFSRNDMLQFDERSIDINGILCR